MDNFNQDLQKAIGKKSFLEYLNKIKKGDVLLRDEFIRANKHFILNVIARILDKSEIAESCTEYNVGLSAFNYSIDNFDTTGENDFYTYSEHIIKEWVLDVISVENSKQSATDETSREYLYRKFEDKDEIAVYTNRLWEFGITLRDLYFLAPQDIDSVRTALKIANIITSNDILFNKLISERNLPLEDLYDRSIFQKKFINRNKDYIISLCLIIKSNLKILQSYLKNIALDKEFSDNVGVILEQYKKEAIVMNFHGQFAVIKIKSNSKSIGKQILLNDNHGFNLAENKILKYSLTIGSMVAAITIIALFSIFITFNHAGKPSSNNVHSLNAVNDSTPVKASLVPTSTVDIKPSPANSAIITKPTDVVEPNKVIPAVNIDPSLDPSKTPALNTAKTKTKPKESARAKASSPASKHASSTVTAKTATTPKSAAKGKPGAISITTSSSWVSAGEYFVLTMHMDGGNNGTALSLYKDSQLINSFTLNDNTPAPQTKTVAIMAEEKGQYSYYFKLTNGYGSSSSNKIAIIAE
jgi:RNA polymerase sigma factor